MLAAIALVGMWAMGAAQAPSLADKPEEAKWELKAESNGVKVHSRVKEGSEIKELLAVGEIDASPAAVFRVLTDFDAYAKTMPYTEESQLLSKEEVGGRKVWVFYTVINAPLASRRDYTLRVTDESDWQDGKGYLKTRWTLAVGKGPGPKDGVVRVKVNDGSWLLEPLANGTRTRASYFLFTDPGGSLPTFVANKANSSAIPDVFQAVRKHVKDAKYAEPK